MRHATAPLAGTVSHRLLLPTPARLAARLLQEYETTGERWLQRWRAANRPHFERGLRDVLAGVRQIGLLRLQLLRRDGDLLDFGLVSARVVTTAGINAIADGIALTAFKYHGIGLTGTAEAASDTALAGELTTQYNPNATRATGTTGNGAGQNVYRTVGLNTVDAAVAIVEHGVFDQPTQGAGVLLDRSVFGAINMAAADMLESTYDLTISGS